MSVLLSCRTDNRARPAIAATPTIAAVIAQALPIIPLHHSSSMCCGVGSSLPVLRLRSGMASITSACRSGEAPSVCYNTSILAMVTESSSKLGSYAQPCHLGLNRMRESDVLGEIAPSAHVHVSPAAHRNNYRHHLRHTSDYQSCAVSAPDNILSQLL